MIKRLRFTLPILALLATSLVLSDVTPADAQNCNSVCNQIRRACRRVARTAVRVEYALCDDQRDTCRVGCETNADTCPSDCDAEYSACSGTECDATLAQCLDDCDGCKVICNEDRVSCRAAAKLVRDTANLTCDTTRETCRTDCVDPIDRDCVRDCKVDRRGCDGDARRDEKLCKKQCPKGTGRRACVRTCRKVKNAGFGSCSDLEVLCLAGCAGITP